MTERRSRPPRRNLDAYAVAILEAFPSGVAVIDSDGYLIAANEAFRVRTLPGSDADLRLKVGDHTLTVYRAARGPARERAAIFADRLESVLATGEDEDEDMLSLEGATDEMRWFRSRIVPLPRELGGVMLLRADVTEQVQAELEMQENAGKDALTGLPARTLALGRLEQAVSQVHRRGVLAVFMIDIDSFKTLNDSLGQETGDELLLVIADRLGAALTSPAWLARFTGDAFLVVAENLRNERAVMLMAEQLRDVVERPIELFERTLVLTASVGIALASSREDRAEDLIRDAEAAGNRAGRSGRGQIDVADGTVRDRAIERLEKEQSLRNALTNGEFHLAYQAEISLDGGRVVGAEALLRWQPEGREVLQPIEFVSLAEETGLIVPIGEWVLNEACIAAAQWPVVDDIELFVAVNVSARQLFEPSLVPMVKESLERSGLRPNRLCIELTESMLVDRLEIAVEVLSALRNLGVLIALDDFGTGYSSLGYLQRLPVDIVKLDRSFVQRLDSDPVARVIVEAVLSLAQALGLRVVAEGVDSEAQRQQLRDLGCDVAQGYSFSRPTDEAAFIDLATRG